MIIYAHQNETVDEIAFRYFGKTKGLVEQIYNLNPKLCLLPAKLPNGTKVLLPKVNVQAKPEVKLIKLWD